MRDITGQKFGMLTALFYVGKYKASRRAVWHFRCACFKECSCIMSNVTTGQTTSCGCKRASSGGLSLREAYTYKSYSAMIRRVFDKTHDRYKNYGGAGIKVYFDWIGPGGFANFFADVGRRPKRKTLDRIDPEGNYEPGNLRYATAHGQRMNQRRMQKKKWSANNNRRFYP
jgi:hypothetical protein